MCHCLIGCCVERDINWHALGEEKRYVIAHTFSIHIQISCFFQKEVHTHTPNAQLSNCFLDIKATSIKQTPMPDTHTGIQVHTHK